MLPRTVSTKVWFAALALLHFGCSAHKSPLQPPSVQASSAPIRLTIVGTNDLHGWVSGHAFKLGDGSMVEEGGLSTFAGYVSILRAENPGGTLLLDAGDLFQGTLAANLTEGAVVIDAYNYLGYQAVALGNHEFDYGPEGPASVATQPGEDPFGALKARLQQAKFPMLAVNLYDAQTGERPSWLNNDGTLLLEMKGLKVAVFGLITPTTPHATNPLNVASLRFGSLLPEAVAAARTLRGRGADLVIGLVHAGGKCLRYNDPRDLSTCDTSSGEIFELLQGLPTGTLDALVAGHTHQVIGHFVNGTPVIETWGLGRSFGVIQLYVDPIERNLIPALTEIRPAIPICLKVDEENGSCNQQLLESSIAKLTPSTFHGRTVLRDRGMDELLTPVLARVESEQKRWIGVSVIESLGRNRDGESALGDVLADTLRELTGADVAILNPGGLRADIAVGELTYGQVYETLPFDDGIAIVALSGEELLRLLRAAYASRRGIFQVSGLKVQLASCADSYRFRGATLSDGGRIQPAKMYRVALPDFLARGGDGFGTVLSSLPSKRIDLRPLPEGNLRNALIAHWQRRNRPLRAPRPDRILFSSEATACAETSASSRSP